MNRYCVLHRELPGLTQQLNAIGRRGFFRFGTKRSLVQIQSPRL